MKRVIKGSYTVRGLSNIFCNQLNIGPENCIDETSTGASYTDSFLDPKLTSYLANNKNLKGHIEYMTPIEYYEACAKIFNSSVSSLKAQRERDTESIDWLTNALESGRKFQLPYVNYAGKGQEGLHRMLVLANKYGWDEYSFPVLVIEYVDERRQIVHEADQDLRKCINKSLDYKYVLSNLPDYLLGQIQFELNNLTIDDESEYQAKVIDEQEDRYILSLEGFEKEIKETVFKEDIQIREEKDLDDFDIDDDILLDDWDDLSIDEILKSLK